MNRRFAIGLLSVALVLGTGGLNFSSEAHAASGDGFAQGVTDVPCPERIVLTALGYIPPNELHTLRQGDTAIVRRGPYSLPTRRGGALEVRGSDARTIWRLWRQLEPGNGAGCFSPGYLMEFYDGAICTLRASICFHCSNAALSTSGGIVGIAGSDRAFARFERHITSHLAPYSKPKGNGGEH